MLAINAENAIFLSTMTQKFSTNPTLNTLIAELGVECQRAISLVHQLQLPNISDRQKVDVLAELNASIIHLQSHCDEDLQDLIADELENISSS
jgi:hypothetical protein